MEADKEELSVDYRPAGVRRRLWRMPVFGLIEQKTAIRPAGVKTMIENRLAPATLTAAAFDSV
jgi:hypothetical protein